MCHDECHCGRSFAGVTSNCRCSTEAFSSEGLNSVGTATLHVVKDPVSSVSTLLSTVAFWGEKCHAELPGMVHGSCFMNDARGPLSSTTTLKNGINIHRVHHCRTKSSDTALNLLWPSLGMIPSGAQVLHPSHTLPQLQMSAHNGTG